MADSWYGGAPIGGNRYPMKIQLLSGNLWGYYIRNVSTGQAHVATTRSRSWAGGSPAWWGGEVVSANDAMGNLANDYDLDIQTQYLWNGTWYRTDGSSQLCIKRKDDPDLVFPTYYHCQFVTQVITNDTMWVHTHDHPVSDVP